MRIGGETMVTGTEIMGAYQGLKAAFGIVEGINATAKEAAINEVKVNLTRHILDAQSTLLSANEAQLAVVQRIADLEQEIMRLKDWSAERESYQLVSIARIAFAYMPKSGMENGQPAHWLCTNCFDHGRKSFMQHKGSMTETLYCCNACKAEFRVPNRSHPDYAQRVPFGR